MHDNIQQLVYTSYATDHCGSDHIREIAHKATAFNKTVGLTGVLLVSGDRFIQLLESPERPLYDLYDRIKQDPRHTAVQTQWQDSAEERLMPTWSMGYLYLNAPDQKHGHPLHPVLKQGCQGVSIVGETGQSTEYAASLH